jgi:hypothetical protein
MAHNRTAPAYQEYAANMMARFEYRTLTLAQRGLLYSMRLECWVNQFLPDSPEVLARILGFDPEEIAAELPYVMAFFEVENGRITSPDLEGYRQRVEGIRERQAQGGKVGAAKTNARKTRVDTGDSNGSGNPSGNSTSNPRASRRVSVESFNPNPNPSPSQEGDGWESSSEVQRWDDFTRDPEEVQR